MNEYLGLPHHPGSPPWAKEATGENLPGWPWDRAREAEPGWPWDPAREAEPGWPWDRRKELDEAKLRAAEKQEAPPRQESGGRFYGQIDLECGDSITVLALEAPKAGDIRRCPRCRVDRAVTHIFPLDSRQV
jgi:hypothetical protein